MLKKRLLLQTKPVPVLKKKCHLPFICGTDDDVKPDSNLPMKVEIEVEMAAPDVRFIFLKLSHFLLLI